MWFIRSYVVNLSLYICCLALPVFYEATIFIFSALKFTPSSNTLIASRVHLIQFLYLHVLIIILKVTT